MAPIAQSFEECTDNMMDEGSGERVVISGMSGLYPESRSVKDLSHILYNKINPVNAEKSRWQYEHPEVAQYTGKVPGLMYFDAQFFKVHYRSSNNMDSMARKILEQAYQAIYDAGISPTELYGKKVGVFIGSCFSETEKACFYVASLISGFGITGCCKAMFANRISYWLNAKGPSMAIDDACCSSTAALEQAYLAMTRGDCEAAIVGGSSLCLHPQSSVHYGRIMQMCMDGKTKSFDSNATGCARSEAINILFLQKAKDALRVYAEVLHVKCVFDSVLEGDTGPKYDFNRKPSNVAAFMKDFYKEAKVSPLAVKYVEAFGSASPEADKSELEAISEVFCKNRSDPLLVGSVMSNIGYVEAATGISAITKVLLGYHTGRLAANLHYETPRQDIPAVREGRIRILDEHQEFDRTYTAVNGFSIAGVNTHVLLHGRYKPKDPSRYKTNIPQLVTVAARQEVSVKNIIANLKSRPIDPEELALFRNIHKTSIVGHLGRGFTILDTNENNETICLCEKSDYFDDVKRPIWFMYSGMGSQWPGMGTQLMRIPIFAAAIERCQRALQAKGINVLDIITSSDKTIFDNILHSFVGIAAIQIGLTDVLTELGIVPDMIIGHSVGELGCAYADGCFTAEEMILSAYSRGLVSLQTPFIRGSMAAVGIGYEQISKMCPPEIEVACHNGPDTSTISGPAGKMKEFVAQLTSKGIFAKEVPCSNIAYHSSYIAEAGPGLLKYLSEVIKSPKPRSERWVSTSIPQHRWNEPIAKYSSAEYHTNNLLNSVLFEETSRLIPANAVVVEIAPHGLLQAIVKRSLPPSCRHVPLTRRGHVDNALFLLEAIGKLYMEGLNPKIEALYPKIEYPVSTGTPMLSHLVEWAHTEKWPLPLYMAAYRKTAAACKYLLSTHDDENIYLKDHVIKGKNWYPFSAALVVVWDTLAMSLGLEKKQFPVQFNDIHFHSQPILHDQRTLQLNIAIHRGTGRFEVLEENTKILTGYIVSQSKQKDRIEEKFNSTEPKLLDSKDIYKALQARDYNYTGKFRNIHNADLSLSDANIIWEDNWVTALDGMIQLNILRRTHETISQPKWIRKIEIDVTNHLNNSVRENGKILIPTKICDIQDYTRCGGIIIENIRFFDLPSICDKNIALKALKFVPHFSSNNIDKVTGLYIYLQIISENLNKQDINVVEIINNNIGKSKYAEMRDIMLDIPDIRVNYSVVYRNNITIENDDLSNNIDLLLVTNLSNDDNMCQILHRELKCNTFVVNNEKFCTEMQNCRTSSLYKRICAHTAESMILELVLWRPSDSYLGTSAFTVLTESDLELLSSRIATLPEQQKIVILTSYPAHIGLKSLTKRLRKEGDYKISMIMVNHKISIDQPLEKVPCTDLALNILDHGIWGGEYYLPVKKNPMKGHGVALNIDRVGDLDSLCWVEAPNSRIFGTDVTVHYAGINDVEVKKKIGVISMDKSRTGYFDFSGLTETGSRVMGLANYDSIQTNVKVKPEFLWPVPAHWSLEEAATVPLAYCLAIYCLYFKSSLKTGMSVLVHGGTGALGQAVISIALGHGCNVFTTVSDNRKKHFLRKLFPELKESQIGNSRDISFADMVLQQTTGLGCNIVIADGVKDDLKTMSIKCVQLSGCVVDTNVVLNREQYDLGMTVLNKARSYYTVDLFMSLEETMELKTLISEGIARGYVRPLTRVTFPPQEAPRAFRLKASNHHRGRVLLDLRKDISFIQTKLNCSPQLCQMVLAENNSMLGIKLVDKLISRGAKKIKYVSTNISNYLSVKLREWAKQGVTVEVLSKNVFNETNISNVLNSNESLADVEGVYYILDKTADEDRKTLEQVTFISRSSLSTLKHATIIYTGGETWEQLKAAKTNEHLLSFIRLPTLKNMDIGTKSEESISEVAAVDAIEKALCLKHRDVVVHSTKTSSQTSFLNEFAAIAGIDIPDDISEEDTITDLGVEPVKFEAIRTYLRNTYHITIEENKISSLTVKTIRGLEEKITDKKFEETEGLKTFLAYVEHDELLATTEMILMPTLANSSEMRDDEFHVNETWLSVIPGVEGLHTRFRTLCERVKLPALVLQPGLNRPQETIQEMAGRYAKFLLKKTQIKDKFYLVGYESGVLVALEMAAILEDQGLIGTVFCIGGSPEDVQSIMKEKLNHYKTEEELQDAVVRHMYTVITSESTDELDKVLDKSFTWKEKIASCVHLLLGRVKHSNQCSEELIKSAYAKILQARRYNSQPRQLRSRIICLRPSTCNQLGTSSMQKHSQQKVVEYQLRAPLAYATQDLQCSAIINRHLDDEILDKFNKKNLCETYILNVDTFMTNASHTDIDM